MNEQSLPDTTTNNQSATANLIYILYLVALIIGITSIVGVIMAYVYRTDSSDWLRTHYTFMIHTFWKGMLYTLISIPLLFIGIGFLTLGLTIIWWIVRCVKGMQSISQNRPISDPTSWLF